MLISIFILVLSLASLIQFAAFTWRAAFLSFASSELPENHAKYIQLNDFQDATAYERLCPEIGSGGRASLRTVSLYHGFLQFLTSIGDAIIPPASGWAQREMALCTRYATVALAQRMERNQLMAADLTSF
jgi:hypothetical protein